MLVKGPSAVILYISIHGMSLVHSNHLLGAKRSVNIICDMINVVAWNPLLHDFNENPEMLSSPAALLG